jgi:hypothetical protein
MIHEQTNLLNIQETGKQKPGYFIINRPAVKAFLLIKI